MQRSTVSQIHVGCSGWVYKHWRGLFYPEGLPQKRWFEFYSEEFDTVESRYSDEALLDWTDWILQQQRAGRSAWCYFNNDIRGHAIEDARKLKSMVGQMSR